MAPRATMAELVEEVCDLFERDRARTGVSNARPKVFPPAAETEIRACEKRIKRLFPPSYVEFLKVTNGIVEYQRVFTLIGVSGEHTEKALADIEKRRADYTAAWEKEHGKATEATVAAFERAMDLSKKKEGDAHIFPGNKFMFATDMLGSLFYFLDPDAKENSEPKVVWRDNLARLIVYDNFTSVLERDIKVLRMRLGIKA
jgi:hypothetical protein